MIIVGRHINGVTLNPLEYILDESDEFMEFKSKTVAKAYLREKGFTNKDFEWLVFETVEDKKGDC